MRKHDKTFQNAENPAELFYISSAGLLSAVRMLSQPPMIPEKASVYAVSRVCLNYSYSIIDIWLAQYVVVFIITWPQYLYIFYGLYCFTEIFWVENWSAIQWIFILVIQEYQNIPFFSFSPIVFSED